MKKFKDFVNEDIKNILQPKSEEEIESKLSKISVLDKLQHIDKFNLPEKYWPSNKEIVDYLGFDIKGVDDKDINVKGIGWRKRTNVYAEKNGKYYYIGYVLSAYNDFHLYNMNTNDIFMGNIKATKRLKNIEDVPTKVKARIVTELESTKLPYFYTDRSPKQDSYLTKLIEIMNTK